jgi:hypothetical protein
MTLEERIAEAEETVAALFAGASGWPPGLIEPAFKRLEAMIDLLHATDDELADLSTQYQQLTDRLVGTTAAAIMIELARRSRLSGHQKIAEAAARARMRA